MGLAGVEEVALDGDADTVATAAERRGLCVDAGGGILVRSVRTGVATPARMGVVIVAMHVKPQRESVVQRRGMYHVREC